MLLKIIRRALKGTPGQIRLAEEDIVADFCIILQLRQPMGRELCEKSSAGINQAVILRSVIRFIVA